MQSPIAGLSQFQKDWDRALVTDDALLSDLIRREPPGVAIFQIAGFCNGIYRAEQRVAKLNAEAGSTVFKMPPLRARIERLLPHVTASRRRLGWNQREVDLALLRWIRQSSTLSPVLGAGVSQGAGAPGWPDLVKALLKRALERGHEHSQIVPSVGNPARPLIERTPEGGLRITGEGSWAVERQVVGIERFTPEDETQAREILGKLEAGHGADTEILMQGAQVCWNLFGQRVFTHVTGLLYNRAPKPSEAHRAIAALAAAQEVPNRGWQPGWESVITYNFDDLMGEAFAEYEIPHARFVMTKEGVGGDPDRLAQQSKWHVPIFHLHGCTPRRPFLITDTRFVFSTAQYRAEYGERKDGLIDRVLERYLANPVHLALYIGCSFIDQEMNGLLRKAAQRHPGRWHYAILKWPEKRDGRIPDGEEIEERSKQYLDIGVQPIWIDDFAEIPGLVKALK